MPLFEFEEEDFDNQIEFSNLEIFLFSIKDGNVDVIKWILFFDYKLNFLLFDLLPFCIACEYNQTEVLKLILSNTPFIDITKHLYHIIPNSIEEGYFELLKILYSFNNDIFVDMNIYDLFLLSIEFDKFDIAKWLFEISKNTEKKINFSSNNYIFINACSQNNIDLAKLLCEIRPRGYYVNIIDNEIVEFEIITSLVINKKIEKKLINKDIDICSICLFETSNVYTSCQHQFCHTCLDNHYSVNNIRCPICRRDNHEDDLKLII